MKPSEQELIHRAQQGENDAFEALVHEYDQRVLSMATSFTGNIDDAKDVYQEVFVRVYRALPGFEFKSQFSTWLYRIVANVCITHRRRNKGRSFVDIDGDVDVSFQRDDAAPVTVAQPVSPEQHVQNVEISRHVQNALEYLSPQQRLAFTLKHYRGFKIREISKMMNCTDGTVKRYLFSATEKMQKRLRNVFR